jgi:hypothetical protein
MVEGDKSVDRWQVWTGVDPEKEMSGYSKEKRQYTGWGVDPPEGFKAVGPWFPFAVDELCVCWRRPLRKIVRTRPPPVSVSTRVK